MHLEFLVEEPSAEAALQNLVPKIIGSGSSFAIHAHQGKQDLLAKLSSRLRAYRAWLREDWRIVVLLDEDREDCKELKAALEKTAGDAGLVTKSTASRSGDVRVLNRVAVEELEAWFFGDIEALTSAYPRVPHNLERRAGYRDPDAIRGGTWERLERVLQDAGYYRTGLPKIEAARRISARMVPENNRSRSFQNFRGGLLALVS